MTSENSELSIARDDWPSIALMRSFQRMPLSLASSSWSTSRRRSPRSLRCCSDWPELSRSRSIRPVSGSVCGRGEALVSEKGEWTGRDERRTP